MNAQDIYINLIKEFIVHGIPIPYKSIAPDLRYMKSTSALGKCQKKNGIYIIYLSRYAMKNEEQIRSTLAHELIHTIKGCLNHGQIFQYYGQLVYQRIGIKVESKATKETADLSGIMEAKMQKAKYIIRCTRCGTSIYRQKKSGLVLHPERYRCSCGGSFLVDNLKQ